MSAVLYIAISPEGVPQRGFGSLRRKLLESERGIHWAHPDDSAGQPRPSVQSIYGEASDGCDPGIRGAFDSVAALGTYRIGYLDRFSGPGSLSSRAYRA